jgi:hypothetical protein
MHFTISRPQNKEKHSRVERRPPHLPEQSALSSASVFKNEFKKKALLKNVYRQFQLKYDV